MFQTNRERHIQVNADREGVKKQIDDKFLAILRIAEKEDSPKNRFDLGYERGRFEIEVENLWLIGGISYQMKFRLIECGKIASRSEDKGWWFMTHEKQIKTIKKKIEFEIKFLNDQIKKRNDAREALKYCPIEKYQEKQSELDTCHNGVNNQYMYLCGVLATARKLDLISKDEYNKLRNQTFDATFNWKE